jgi:DNA recombination protein RmuC
MDYISLFIGIVIGFGIGFLLLRGRNSSNAVPNEEILQMKSEVASLNQAIAMRNEEIQRIRSDAASVRESLDLKIAEAEKWKADSSHFQEKLASQKKEMEEVQERMNLQFRNIASDLLEEKSKKFTESNKENIDSILKPLREKLGEFERKVEETHKEGLLKNEALKTQLDNLQQLNVQMSQDAVNLTKALKGENKTQGNWGEFILESVLEKSGLVKDREYEMQVSLTDEEGNRLQPDVIVRLPDSKAVVIDSKVSLVAYERYSASEDRESAEQAIKEHTASLKNHIKGLAGKNYQKIHGIKSLDFVLLFIPIEPAFAAAIQTDYSLFQEALDKNVVIVSPSTLLATLRTIASIWRQEYQNRNALEIAKRGSDLYDKFVGFTEDMTKLGNQIESTQRTYEESMKKLSTGRGSLVTRAREMQKLGLSNTKTLNSKLTDTFDDHEASDQEQA